MSVFKTRVFDRWAGKAGVTDPALLKAVADIERGLIDADLGSNLFKQRVALPGRGKSGNSRTLLASGLLARCTFFSGLRKRTATTFPSVSWGFTRASRAHWSCSVTIRLKPR
jgi:hypothetical protein